MHTVFTDIAAVTAVAALLAWLTLIARQPVILGYILAGVVLGPWGLGVVREIAFIDSASHIGVTLLLFLAGVVLHPHRLFALFRETVGVTLGAGALFAVLGAGFVLAFGRPPLESAVAGVAFMFSSTILVIKLLPTTTLHQKRMGSLCIAVLVAQDIIAVGVLLLLNAGVPSHGINPWVVPFAGIGLLAAAFPFEQYVLRRIMHQVEHYHEALYLVALGWCFGLAIAAERVGLSHEVGAFVAGLTLARSPVSLFLSEGLKFFRDFFLVLFFFTLGARIDLLVAQKILLPALGLAALLLVVKPVVFRMFFTMSGEKAEQGREIGVRLGQASEFSMIVAVYALQAAVIEQWTAQLIQLTTIITMIVSSYATVFLYPTPLGSRRDLKQD